MADAIRDKIMTLFAKRRKISRAMSPGILPGIIHQLNAASRAKRYCPSPTSIVLLQPDASNETPRARRYCPSPTDIELLVSRLTL